jgi:CRISPR/Cas system CSM-associated protein Csm3 (group 7 of RAMP superfamily)
MRHTVVERICARGIWTAETALHVGGEPGDFDSGIDLVIVRDSSGRPYIPAASLAGASRSHLARILLDTASYRNEREPAELHVLFGDDYQSLLTFLDAPLKSNAKARIRDGVKIDPDTGTAEDQKKYDFEVLPAGAAFQIEFALTLYQELPDYCAKRSNEREDAARQAVSMERIKSCFRLLLESFQAGEIHLGAKTRRGLGKGRVDSWELRCLEMNNREAFAAWLSNEPYSYFACPLDSLGPALAAAEVPAFSIDATFALESSLLIRSAGEDDSGPEFVHLSENGKPLFTGTGFAGALRHRAARIANTINPQREPEGNNTNVDLIERIFGYVHEDDRENPAGASRLRISEVSLPGGRDRLHVQGRVSIDRFTGGALETALFDEAAYWPKADEQGIKVRLSLEDPRAEEVGLLLLAFKDLWLGDLPIGGEVGVGRGVLKGRHATLRRSGFSSVDLSHDGAAGKDVAWLNQSVDQLWRSFEHA